MESVEKFELMKSLLLTIVIGLWLYWLWTRRDLYRFSLKYPGFLGPPIVGVLGKIKHMNYLFPVFGKMFADCQRHTICIWMGLHAVLVTADPDIIEQVLSSPELLNKAKSLYHPVYEVFEGGIIASPATEWANHRKLINPAFSHKVLLSFFPIFNKAKKMALVKFDALVDNGEHALAEMLQRISLGITVETTLGKPMKEGDEVDVQLAKKFNFMMQKLANQCLLAFLNLDGIYNLSIKFMRTRYYLYNFLDELLKQKMNKLNVQKIDEPNNNNLKSSIKAEGTAGIDEMEDSAVIMKKPPMIFIDQAFKLYQQHQFTWHDIICESATIASASFDTTANGVFSTLVMLAIHPEVQERLYEEILNVFPDKNFDMKYEDMQHLPYLGRVLDETLRLAPSVPLIGRQVVKDTQISKDLILPKNIQIMISIFHLHRRKDIWGPNAEKFDPDNFLPENFERKHHYAYIPFSKGVRNCIGWRYAQFAIKVLLTGLLRNYRFTTRAKLEDLQFVDNIALKYLKEPLLQINRR